VNYTHPNIKKRACMSKNLVRWRDVSEEILEKRQNFLSLYQEETKPCHVRNCGKPGSFSSRSLSKGVLKRLAQTLFRCAPGLSTDDPGVPSFVENNIN